MRTIDKSPFVLRSPLPSEGRLEGRTVAMSDPGSYAKGERGSETRDLPCGIRRHPSRRKQSFLLRMSGGFVRVCPAVLFGSFA